jgi:hypothetical protein
MKKIKTTQGVVSSQMSNKENNFVAPPNIIKNIRTMSSEHPHFGGGGATPTEAP